MQIETTDLSESIEFKPIGESKNKKQIILCETKRDYKNYIESLKSRYNGKNPYLPNYVINRDGKVYKIMEPKKYSMFMNTTVINKNAIIICLENFGWLEKKPIENIYLNWIGDIYKKEVFEKKWRDRVFWQPYNKQEQIESLVNLLKELCKDFEIPKVCPETNVILTNVENFKGIVSKSSFGFDFKDLNPSFDFKLLQKLLNDDK
jgi:hypothetical protein